MEILQKTWKKITYYKCKDDYGVSHYVDFFHHRYLSKKISFLHLYLTEGDEFAFHLGYVEGAYLLYISNPLFCLDFSIIFPKNLQEYANEHADSLFDAIPELLSKRICHNTDFRYTEDYMFVAREGTEEYYLHFEEDYFEDSFNAWWIEEHDKQAKEEAFSNYCRTGKYAEPDLIDIPYP